MKKVVLSLLTVILAMTMFAVGIAEDAKTDLEAPASEAVSSEVNQEEAAGSEDTGEQAFTAEDSQEEKTSGNRKIALEADSNVIYKGKQAKITASVEKLSDDAPAKTILVWETSDKDIVTVSAAGALNGKAAGKATITASAKDDPSISAAVEIEVRLPVQSVKINEKNPTVVVGAGEEASKIQLTATINPADAHYQTGTWSSANEDIATVDENGIVQGLAVGTAKITFQSDDPSGKKTQISVKVNQAITGINLSENSVKIDVGKTSAIKAEVSPKNAGNKKVTWTSSNENVATVSATGAVKAIGKGSAVITCTAADGSGVYAQCNVDVISMIKSIKPSGSKKVIIFAGKSENLHVTLTPSNPSISTLRWSSSDTSVATVDSAGCVTGKSKGKCNITAEATDGSGKKTVFNFIVEPALPITLESVGFGIFMPNLFGQTVINHCLATTIVNYDFDITLKTGWGSESGSYNLGKNVSIRPGAKKTIKRNHYGIGYTSKVTITITGVYLKDGSYYSIPSNLQETWTFSR